MISLMLFCRMTAIELDERNLESVDFIKCCGRQLPGFAKYLI